MRLGFLFILGLILLSPSLAFADVQVMINEIDWAGTKASASDEWIELYNNSDAAINLDGWILRAKDGAPIVNLSGSISSFGFYLIERTADITISDISADYVGSFGKYGNLSNTGEDLELVNASGEIIDKVYFSSGWPAGAGNPDYISMEKVNPYLGGSDQNNWKSNNGAKINGKDADGNSILGTPKQQNSVFNQSNQTNQAEQFSQTNQINQTQFQNSSPRAVTRAVKVSAGENKLGIAGADVKFIGEARDSKDELLDYSKTRFIWNFGDGSFKEGRAVNHIYSFPGEYVAVLDVASGEYATSDIISVKIIPNEIAISEISALDSWIELYNNSKEALDISFWGLSSAGEKVFYFPKNTFFKPKGYLVISAAVSGLNLNRKKGEIKFLYPNGSLADKFIYEGKIREGESFVFTDGKIFVANQTPGKENAETMSPIQNQPANILIQSQASIQSKFGALPQESHRKISDKQSKTKILTAESIIGEKSNSENNLENAASSAPAEIENSVLSDSENQANVSESAGNFSSTAKWLLIVFGIAIFSGAGFFILKKSM